MHVDKAIDSAHKALAEKNYATASHLFSELANAGSTEAERFLGWIQEKGLGVEPSKTKAIAWYQKAANKGDEWSLIRLGTLFEQQNAPDEAMRFYTVAASAGSIRAEYRLGHLYKKVHPNQHNAFEQSLFHFRRAAERGHVWAQAMLVHHMFNGRIPGGRWCALRATFSLVLGTVRIARQCGGKLSTDPRFMK